MSRETDPTYPGTPRDDHRHLLHHHRALLVFVAIVQAFLKFPALNALAPHQTEPPFLLAQGLVLALFVVLTVLAAKRFRGAPIA